MLRCERLLLFTLLCLLPKTLKHIWVSHFQKQIIAIDDSHKIFVLGIGQLFEAVAAESIEERQNRQRFFRESEKALNECVCWYEIVSFEMSIPEKNG